MDEKLEKALREIMEAAVDECEPTKPQYILDYLKAIGYTIEPDWQPIETAPRDGTLFLVGLPDSPDHIGICWYFRIAIPASEYGHKLALPDDWEADAKPTHWKPLPPPPDKGEAQEPQQ